MCRRCLSDFHKQLGAPGEIQKLSMVEGLVEKKMLVVEIEEVESKEEEVYASQCLSKNKPSQVRSLLKYIILGKYPCFMSHTTFLEKSHVN